MLKRTKRSGNQKGFTLIEILIVIIIVGVLAGLAVPVYQAQVVRAYRQEALQTMGTTRESLMRYFAQNNGTYVGADITAAGCNLDYCPNAAAAGGQTRYFTYTLGNLGAATFTLTATGNGTGNGPTAAQNVTLNQAGTVGGNLT
jgi:prepilin-type N-terminal cleavage/methylation domain-containing protein